MNKLPRAWHDAPPAEFDDAADQYPAPTDLPDPDPALPSAVSAVDYVIAQGGGTFRIGSESRRLILDHPTSGYAVGVHRGTFRTIKLGSSWTVADAAAAMLAARDVNDATYVGAWIEDGVIHVDPVEIVTRRGYALGLARYLNQQAVYDFAAGESINV